MAFLEWSIARLVCLGDANALLLAITNNIIMGAIRRVTFFWGGGGVGGWNGFDFISGICLLIIPFIFLFSTTPIL